MRSNYPDSLRARARLAFEHDWPSVCAFLPKGVRKSKHPQAKSVRQTMRQAAIDAGQDRTTHLHDGRVYSYRRPTG